jgi:predicted transcriptional regulator
MIRPTSFRLPDETLNRLRALAQPHEPMASVIERAVAALEAAPRPRPTDDITALFASLEARVAWLELRSAAAVHVPRERSAPVVQSVAPRSSGVAQPVAQGRSADVVQSNYPVEVQRLAVELRRSGAGSGAIIAAIAEATGGRAPSRSNLARTLAGWAELIDAT